MQNYHFKLWGNILILDEPIATETKHRLLSLLFPWAYQPKTAYGNQKNSRHQTCKGVERFDPFHSMHYEYDESVPTDWIDILEGRAEVTLLPLYDTLIAEFSGEDEVERGRRIAKWHFFQRCKQRFDSKDDSRNRGKSEKQFCDQTQLCLSASEH